MENETLPTITGEQLVQFYKTERLNSFLLEEAIALLEQTTKNNYDHAFITGHLESAKLYYQKLLNLKDLREKLKLIER